MKRGIFLHSAAKLIVILSAYILHFFLGRILTISEYGIIGLIINVSNFYYIFLTNGVRQTLSKDIAGHQYDFRQVARRGFIVQLGFGLIVALLGLFISPTLAIAFANPQLTTYFRLLSLLIIFTAIYFGMSGVLNGAKRFVDESIVTSLYPLLRLTAIPFTLLLPLYKPAGTLIGFIFSSFITSIITCLLVIRSFPVESPQITENYSYGKLIKSSSLFIITFATVTLIMNLDLFTLQIIKKDPILAGYYTAIHTFSLVPYYMISAFYLVILPYISENYHKGDYQNVTKIVQNNLINILLYILPVVILISFSGKEILQLFYNPKYLPAVKSLSVLIFGTFFLSLYVVMNMVINGMGLQKNSAFLSMGVLAIDILLLLFLVPKFGLIGSVTSTSISSFLGFIFSFAIVCTKLPIKMKSKQFLRPVIGVFIFMIIAALAFQNTHTNNFLFLIFIYCVLGIIYLLILSTLQILQIKRIVFTLSEVFDAIRHIK